MKHYLSFGGGVNSVALHLLMLEKKIDFESIFVDHGTDYPETYEYFEMFNGWLEKKGLKKIKRLIPDVEGFKNLYDYSFHYSMVPSIMMRWCTDKFKIKIVHKYIQRPCFMHIGIDSGESKRAKISYNKGIENRYLLIENEIDRNECKRIIEKEGLKIPKKSGCFICPFQRKNQFIELRRIHPDLYCKALKLEKKNKEYRESKGKKPLALHGSGRDLQTLVEEKQMKLFDKYPPCQCGL